MAAVLVAIAIPVFTTQLEKSREATDLANVRSAYAELVTAYLTDGTAQNATVASKQTIDNWQSNGDSSVAYIGTGISVGGSTVGSIEVPCQTNGAVYRVDQAVPGLNANNIPQE